jgi:hypothetical protein
MGRSYLITRIVRKVRTGEHLGEWRPSYGKPTSANLGTYRDAFNASLLPGGVNAHLGTGSWLLCNLEIYNQRTGKVEATYVAPMFETIP